MRARRAERWAEYHREAEAEWPTRAQDPAFMFGIALYIGEGGKTSGNRLTITNCDARVIKQGLAFFLSIGVPKSALRCALHVHPGLSQENAEQFWQQVTAMPPEQFHTTRDAVNRASSGIKGHIQVHGTCQIHAYSTELCQKVHRWMELALNAPLV